MRNSGGKTKTVYKLKKHNAVLTCLIFLGVFMITLGGLLTTKSSLVDMLKFKASGDVPSHSKEIIDNHDGTWKLSLDVVGEAEKKAQKANVIIVFDTSSSMNRDSGTDEVTYTLANDTGNPRYGKDGEDYFRLYRHRYLYTAYNGTPTSGTYYGWYNNEFVQLYYNNGTWYRTRSYGWGGYNYSNPYNGTFYSRGNDNAYRYYKEDGTQYTGDRYIRTEANQSRLEAAQAATNELANALLSNNDIDGNDDDTIEIALVDFANTAVIAQEPTNEYSDFEDAVNDLNAGNDDRGTNWESGFSKALDVDFNDDDQTFVIFVSDGNPTFRDTQNGTANSTTGRTPWNDYNNGYGAYGTGGESDQNVARCYSTAVPKAKAIVDAGYDLYTIFAYGDTSGANHMRDITTAAGAPAANNYSAANTAALQAAFAEILARIEMSGISDVSIEDGTTEAVKIESTDTNGMLVVDTNSFEYTITIPITEGKANIKGQEATLTGNTLTWGNNKSVTGTIDADGNFVYKWIGENPLTDVAPNPAQDNGGTVTWDLSNAGVLINGAKYSVTFDVWPSQETYDLVADLKNGTKKYSELDPGITKYLSDTYELKTNTNAKITYTDTRNDAGEQESGYTNPDPVATNSSSISIKKEWDNELDARTDRPVTVSLNRDGSNFITVNLDGTPDDEWETAAWEATNISIATGLARLSDDGELEVLDVGHDYKFSELGSEAFNWELETETVHPMLINGTLTKLLLVEDESEIPSQLNEKDYYNGYYRLANGNVYKDAGTTNPQIKTINHRRSNFNLKKVVNGENANPNTEFEFTIRVTQKDEKDKVIADDSTTNDDDLWFSVQDKDGNWVDYGASIGEWTRYVGLDNQTGKTTYYYYAPNNTQLVIKLKADYNLRFTNLVSNTDISVVEGNTTNYSLEEITTPSGFDSENDSKTISGKTFTGHIGENNSSYQVQYKNKNDVPETIDIPVEKVWLHDNGGEEGLRTSVEVELFTVEGETETTTGKKLTLSESNQWKGTFENLVKYANGKEVTYTVKENTENSHYTTTVTGDNSGFTVTNDRDTTDITVDVPVEKKWEGDVADGIQPSSVEVTLLADGEKANVDNAVVNLTAGADGKWKYTWEKLAKYIDGKEVTYTVSENTDKDNIKDHYETSITGNMTNGYVITNKRNDNDKTVDVPVEKKWEGDIDDGIQPSSVEVTLLADGEKANVDNAVVNLTADATGKWSYTWEKLAKYIGGKEVVYTVKENTDKDNIKDHYETSITGNMTNGYVITNKRNDDDKTIDIPVDKVWLHDNNGAEGLRTAIEVELYTVEGQTETTTGKKLTLSESNQWKDTFEKLAKYANGKEVVYTVKENTENSHYVTTVFKNNDGSFTVTNDRDTTDVTVDIPVEKKWEGDVADGIQPSSVEVTLLADGEKANVDDAVVNLTADATGKWSYTWEKLAKYIDGKEVTYSVSENTDKDNIKDHYETSISGNMTNGYVITNKRNDNDKTVDVPVEKKWEGDIDDGIQPSSVEVTLLADGEKANVDNAVVNLTADATGKWSYTWEKLAKYINGKEVTYSVSENTDKDNIKDHYETSITGNMTNGYVITNKRNDDDKTIDIPVDKVWLHDNNGAEGLRTPIEVELFTVEGETETTTGKTLTLSERNQWKDTFEKLAKYADGKEVVYTVKENTENEHYTTTVSKNEDGSFTVTNDRDTNDVYTSSKVIKIWEDSEDHDGFRPTTLTVILSDGTQDFEPTTITAEGGWTKTVDNLPKYKDGKLLEYSWTENEEELPEGYSKVSEETKNNVTTITNKYEVQYTNISVKKVWDDAGDQDGLRPENLDVFLNDGVKTTKYQLTADKDWELTIENLDKYRNGQLIPYTWTEGELPEGYEMDGDPVVEGTLTTITNKHVPETTESTIVKVWDDDNDRDGIQPTELKVTLNDKDSTKVTLNEGNEWTATISGLPKYENHGQEIDYRWTEEDLDDYTIKSNGKVNTVQTITNHYDPELTYVCVKKIWDDDNDRDRVRPGTLTLGLTSDDESYEGTEVTLSADTWEATVERLFKYHNHGQKVTYTWTEKDLPEGYTLTNTEPSEVTDEETGLTGVVTTLTNTHNIALTEATVKKVWDDNNDQDGLRPETLSIKLLGDKKAVQKDGEDVVVTLSESTRWSATVTGLPLNDKGTPIEYTWEEVDLPEGYELTDTSKEGTVTTLTNTHEPEKIDIPVKKEWPVENQFGFPNPSVVVNLVDNGEVLDSRTLSADNNWEDAFTGLDKYRNHGEEIPYEVTEVMASELSDYDTKITGSIEEGFTVINTYNPTLVPVEVTKTWDDASDQDGVRPTSILMTLTGTVNGDEVIKTEATTVSGGNDVDSWTYTFQDLPEKYLGQKIEYKVTETLEDGSPYTGTSVTNVEIKNSYNPQTITYSIFKGWDDNDNQDGKRPESITVHLLQDGVEIETLTLNDESGWMIDFGPLPKYRDHGTEINYTIIEDPVKYYENTQTRYDKYEEDNYTAAIVVNTHEPEKAHIGIKKIWNDQDNKYKYRPESITVQILANGEVVDTVKLTAEGNWELDVVGLDKYANGKEIEYTIKELPVEHYTTAIDGFTITNTVEPPSEPEIIPPNTGIDGIGETASEKYLALLMAIITMFASVGVKRLYE